MAFKHRAHHNVRQSGMKKPLHGAAFFQGSGSGLPPRLWTVRLRAQLFLDAGRLAAALAQVVQLGAAHVTAGDDLDLLDHR